MKNFDDQKAFASRNTISSFHRFAALPRPDDGPLDPLGGRFPAWHLMIWVGPHPFACWSDLIDIEA